MAALVPGFRSLKWLRKIYVFAVSFSAHILTQNYNFCMLILTYIMCLNHFILVGLLHELIWRDIVTSLRRFTNDLRKVLHGALDRFSIWKSLEGIVSTELPTDIAILYPYIEGTIMIHLIIRISESPTRYSLTAK